MQSILQRPFLKSHFCLMEVNFGLKLLADIC